MRNLLIIEDNLIEAYSLINCICRKIPNIRLYNIVSTGMEAIDIIKEGKVDIIILDLKLPDMSGMEIIDFISKNNIIKYNSSIIVYTNEMNLLNKIITNKYVFCYCSKINNIDFMINKINDLIDKKKKENNIGDVKKQIKLELKKLNFDFSYTGTKYLCDCIYECYCKKMIYNINFNKNVYPIISEKYKKTVNSIKTNIFYSISIMYYETDENILSDYFGYKIISKPKTMDIITTILQKL